MNVIETVWASEIRDAIKESRRAIILPNIALMSAKLGYSLHGSYVDPHHSSNSNVLEFGFISSSLTFIHTLYPWRGSSRILYKKKGGGGGKQS